MQLTILINILIKIILLPDKHKELPNVFIYLKILKVIKYAFLRISNLNYLYSEKKMFVNLQNII